VPLDDGGGGVDDDEDDDIGTDAAESALVLLFFNDDDRYILENFELIRLILGKVDDEVTDEGGEGDLVDPRLDILKVLPTRLSLSFNFLDLASASNFLFSETKGFKLYSIQDSGLKKSILYFSFVL